MNGAQYPLTMFLASCQFSGAATSETNTFENRTVRFGMRQLHTKHFRILDLIIMYY